MKVVVIGATGFIGAKIFEEAALRGYDVVAISRNPPKELPKGKCSHASVDIFNLQELEKALKGADIVIHAYCPPKDSTFEKMEELQVNATKNIIEAAKKVGARRLLAVGGAGTLITNGARNMDSPGFPPAYMPLANATSKVLSLVLEQKDVPGTVLCPSMEIYPGEKQGKFRLSGDETIFNEKGESKISNSDYAVAMIDEIANGNYIGKRFTVGY
ncbi:NAD(P)-dependent oxidoreductase [Histomonas meleagridis]|uniref:NAD(P)-dependent oxidoreductase n=1 Tax=Histomonas meleagridis TaxID=135588 RepID=UPI003559F6A5|nr:NAD(P)-dependent oxidoreductase [Histomonas meleagridis]KAH0797348.1 NAD(P)-dependent oxidoreductase [Histomonas meleagridis]